MIEHGAGIATVGTGLPVSPERVVVPCSLRVRASRAVVFTAWTDPAIATKWLCDRLEGGWIAGKTLKIFVGQDPETAVRQDLRISAVETDRRLEFRWKAYGDWPETSVTIEFLDQPNGETGMRVRESDFPLTKEGVARALDSACGWENIFCRAKAWIEFGARLLD